MSKVRKAKRFAKILEWTIVYIAFLQIVELTDYVLWFLFDTAIPIGYKFASLVLTLIYMEITYNISYNAPESNRQGLDRQSTSKKSKKKKKPYVFIKE